MSLCLCNEDVWVVVYIFSEILLDVDTWIDIFDSNYECSIVAFSLEELGLIEPWEEVFWCNVMLFVKTLRAWLCSCYRTFPA
jgi:hypothetical protein